MSILRITNVSYSQGIKTIFDDISFTVNTGDRVGLVGDNGCGKSTLLHCLMGNLELDAGSCSARGSLSIGYMEQSVPTHLEPLTLYEALENAIPEEERVYSGYKVDMALEALKAPEDLWLKSLSELSGGWRRLALIARATLNDPEVLLLDEPTNHLDLEKIFRLESFLKEVVTVPYVIVSHDRAFLDNCTRKTAFLREGKLLEFSVPYSQAAKALLEEDIAKAKARSLEETEIARLRRSAKRIKVWNRGRNPDLDKRVKAINHRADRLASQKTDVYQEKERHLELADSGLDAKVFLKVSNLNVEDPEGKFLFHIENLVLRHGDRLALMGFNGTGKSQFMRALVKAYRTPDAKSSIYFQPRVKLGYVDQNQSEFLEDENEILVNILPSRLSISRTENVRELVRAGFPVEEHQMKVRNLSNGQRSRVMFLLLKRAEPNFFLMDEPTNHLDIDGQGRLEDQVLSNDSTCILVSHDRTFVDQLANTVMMIDKGRLVQISDPQGFYGKLKID